MHEFGAKIETLTRELIRCLNEQKIDELMGLYTDDAELFVHGEPYGYGHETTIRTYYEEYFKSVSTSRPVIESIQVKSSRYSKAEEHSQCKMHGSVTVVFGIKTTDAIENTCTMQLQPDDKRLMISLEVEG